MTLANKMEIIALVQGSEAWHQHRANSRNASDAPAVMGCSPYKSRSDLLRERATGIAAEVDAATARRFENGHRFEALARPLAQALIGEELSPCVGKRSRYSASFDGLTFLSDVAWEHKTLNDTLRGVMREQATGEDLPLYYRAQMEHQAMVSGCDRILFTASQWTDDRALVEARHCWYEPDAELRAHLLAAWEQFDRDVAAYVAPPSKPAPVIADAMESLPAVSVRLDGKLAVISNLPDFDVALRAFIKRIPVKPETDQDFANAEAACKALKRSEDALTAGEDAALGEMVDFEAMRRQVRDLKELARTTRLATEKLVAARKEQLRGEIVAGGVAAYRTHVDSLNASLGKPYMPNLAVDFGGAVKNKRTVDSLRGAVDDELARAKIAANDVAAKIQTNLNALREQAGAHAFLFADASALVQKELEFVALTITSRIAEHEAAEAARLEREREAIRAEESAKLQREADEKARADAAAALAQQQTQSQAGGLTSLHFQKPVFSQSEDFGVVTITAAPEAGVAAVVSTPAAQPKYCCPTGETQGLVGRACADCSETSQAYQAAMAAPKPEDTGARVNLTAINEHFAPIMLTSVGLATLGFEPVATVKASKLYRACDMPAMAAALISHIHSLAMTPA